MGTDQPVIPAVTVTPEDLLQRAIDLLYKGNDPKTGLVPLESTRAAAALTSIAHEIRVAESRRGSRTMALKRPADFGEDILGVQWREVPNAKGYNIVVVDGRTTVEPVFTTESHEDLSSGV